MSFFFSLKWPPWPVLKKIFLFDQIFPNYFPATLVLLCERRFQRPHAAAKKTSIAQRRTISGTAGREKRLLLSRGVQLYPASGGRSRCGFGKRLQGIYQPAPPQGRGRFLSLVLRILSNTALSFVKRRGRQSSLEDWDEAVSPLENRAEILAVREELARLAPKYREVLILSSTRI